MRSCLAHALFSLVLVCCFQVAASAQSSGIVRGGVTDANGASVTGASVAIENATNGYRQATTTDDEGRYTFFNVPFNAYTLRVSQTGFTDATQDVALRSNVPLETDVRLAVAAVGEQVEVTANSELSIEPTRSEIAVDSLSIGNLTSALPSRQIESLVLSVPGIVRDGKGVFHARGAHNQSSFVIDGIPVSDQLSAIYANNFDARNIEGMSVQLGNIAPEFGNKASAVIQVTTQSGLGRGRPVFGNINIGGGSFGSGETSFKLGGENSARTFGYFISAANSFTSRYLDPPFQNATADFGDGRVVTAGGAGLNNYGNGQSLFTRFDYVPNDRNFFKLNIVVARSRFNIANTPSQELNGQRQVQQNRNLAIYPSWQHVFNERWAMTIAPYLRFSTAVSSPSAGDTPVAFSVSRHLPTFGAVANATYVGNDHTLKFGIDAFAFPSSEAFNFQFTDPTFNPLPANSVATINPDGSVNFAFDSSLTQSEINSLLVNFNPNLLAYDRTILAQAAANNSSINGAPRLFNTAQKRTGKQFSAYLQDTYTFRNLTIGGGVRFDRYNFLRTETALSPRLGLAYRIPQTDTIFRASYNRIMQTPSTENLLISGSEPAAALVNPLTIRLFGSRTRQIPAERSHWFEVGARQSAGRVGRLDVAYYRKGIRDLHDNDQFLNTTIIFPISISRGRVQGLDLRFDTARKGGFGGYFSLGFVQALVTPPFSGGLFLSGASVDTFGGEEFVIDHDQRQTMQGAVQYSNRRRGIFAQFLVRHDGGLVTGVSAADAPALAANPDTAAGLALLELTSEVVRVRSRTIYDASFAYDFIRREPLRFGVQ
ncbi:MAG: carboxypeptidase regulatory-like domain-containing protein, partial [Pyrinomonadaceae bacterium]